MIRTDDAITGDIIAAFAASPDIHETSIRVHTERGWARLEGVVDTLQETAAAERVAREVPGVVSVENDLIISSDGSISDLKIERGVGDHLVAAGLANVGARVEAGTAFLMGVVPSLAIEQRAIEKAGAVRGVRDVVSELEIAAGEPIDDTTLANDVAEALSDEPRLWVMNLHVAAENGLVMLAGEVPKRWQVRVAGSVAEAVPGVRYVKNRMKVRKIAP